MALETPALTAESGTLSAGVITLGGALSGGFQTFADGMTTDGNTVHVAVKDANDVHSWREATWNQSAGTLTLGTEEGNTGTLSDGAVEVWATGKGDDTGNGDVVGPSGIPNNSVVRFDGTTGKLIQSSGLEIADEAANVIQVTAAAPAADMVHFAANPGVNDTGFLFGKTTSVAHTAQGAYTAHFKGPTGGAYNHAAGFEAGESGAEIIHLYNVNEGHVLRFDTSDDEELVISGTDATSDAEQWHLELGIDPFMVFGGTAAQRVGSNEMTVVGGGEFTASLTVGGSAVITEGDVLDEDNMASDSASAVPTQQSTKAYVDAVRYPAHNTLTPSAGAVSIPMDGRSHLLTLPSGGITSVTLTGIADADTKQHWASVIINPPATGTEAFGIPVAWKQYGPLDTISLADTDEPVVLVLQTLGDNATTPTIAYTAQGGT